MDFRDQLKVDQRVFYNKDELSLAAKAGELEFTLNPCDHYELDDMQNKQFYANSTDVLMVEVGDVIEVEGEVYKLLAKESVDNSLGLDTHLIMENLDDSQ